MSRSMGTPTLFKGLQPSRFRLIPLDVAVDGSPQPDTQVGAAPVSTRLEFVNLLISLSATGRTVAIQDDLGRYISCGANRILPNALIGRPAQYVRRIGRKEQFRIHHCVAKGTFAFQSLDGGGIYNRAADGVVGGGEEDDHRYFLGYSNASLGGYVTLTQCDVEQSTWMVHPVGLSSKGDDPSGGEHLIFLGVVTHEGQFLLERAAEGTGPRWREDLDEILQSVLETLPDGSCTFFQHPATGDQWSIVKYDGTTLGMVVSTSRFPPSLAAECHDDLTLLYKKSIDPRQVRKMEELGLDRKHITGKELAALMMDYDEQHGLSSRNTHLSKVEEDLQALQGKMNENIQSILNTMEKASDIESKTSELLEQSKQFKKRAAKLPKGWRRTTILAGAGLGAGAGAVVGWLIGGPGGSLILATEGAEIGAVAVTGSVLGLAICSNRTVSFWSRRFVQFAFPTTSRI
jgi:Synaptobrevin